LCDHPAWRAPLCLLPSKQCACPALGRDGRMLLGHSPLCSLKRDACAEAAAPGLPQRRDGDPGGLCGAGAGGAPAAAAREAEGGFSWQGMHP